jgi:hypothetical protein
MPVRGEYAVKAHVLERKEVVTGNADYVLGYDPIKPSTSKAFESTSVILEAKKDLGVTGGLAQTIAYMVGIQQQRMRLRELLIPRMAFFLTASVGASCALMRSDCKFLSSQPALTLEGRRRIYCFVDAIVSASIVRSPHTTPQRLFPETKEQWQRDVESPIFRRPRSWQELL